MKYFLLFSMFFFGNESLNAQVGINTEEPRTTLDVNGKTTIRDTPLLNEENDLSPLFIDKDGLVGRKFLEGSLLTEEVFYAEYNKSYAATDYLLVLADNATPTASQIRTAFNGVNSNANSNKDVFIALRSDSFVYNTVGIQSVKVGNIDCIKFTEPGIYEFDIYINFNINGTHNDLYFIAIVAEYSEDNGQTWNALTGSRPVFTKISSTGSGTTGTQNFPHTLPSAVKKMEKDWLVRLKFNRTRTASGDLQGNNVGDIAVRRVVNYGTKAFMIDIKKL